MSHMACMFSSSTFAHVSQDNRLHLWDIESRKEKKAYIDKNHLSHSFTAFAWNKAICSSSNAKENVKQLGNFVMGFNDGQLLVWDLTRGVISKTIKLKDNHANVPSSIVFSQDQSSIFVSSNQIYVLQYSLASGELVKSIKAGKKSVTKMCINPKVDVLAISRYCIGLMNDE